MSLAIPCERDEIVALGQRPLRDPVKVSDHAVKVVRPNLMLVGLSEEPVLVI